MSREDDKFVPPAAAFVWPQCFSCRHRSRVEVEGVAAQACAAFPGGIPGEILDNRRDHRQPYLIDGEPADTGIPGAGSILFAPRPDVPPDALKLLYRALDALPPRPP